MRHSIHNGRVSQIYSVSFAAVMILSLSALPCTVLAKSSGDADKDRTEYYGIIQARPENGLQGEWMIGDRTYTADAGTEFDQSEGPLTPGGCAKVKIRNSRVREIDSEPMRDCR